MRGIERASDDFQESSPIGCGIGGLRRYTRRDALDFATAIGLVIVLAVLWLTLR